MNPPFELIRQGGGPEKTFDVVGSTCMEKDILLRDITAPCPSVGDYIRIDRIGAYTVVLTPPFIHPAPAILADEGGGDCKLIRKKQTLDDIFANYMFETIR